MGTRTLTGAVLLLLAIGGLLWGRQDGPGNLPPKRDCEGEYRRCVQGCFDSYANNQEFCRDLWCDSFLFFTWCEDEELNACLDAAEATYQACMQSCAASLAGCQDGQVG